MSAKTSSLSPWEKISSSFFAFRKVLQKQNTTADCLRIKRECIVNSVSRISCWTLLVENIIEKKNKNRKKS